MPVNTEGGVGGETPGETYVKRAYNHDIHVMVN